MITKACPHCGAEFTDYYSTHPYIYCPHCGGKLEIPDKHKQAGTLSWTLTEEDKKRIRNRNKNIKVKEESDNEQ